MDIINRLKAKGEQKHREIAEALADDSEVRRFYDGAVVFITGASGFLGKQLLEKLFRVCNISKAYILIRPKRGRTVEERVKRITDDTVYDYIRKEQPNFATKVIPIAGDVSEINLGICEQDWALLTNEINIIFHAGATVNFGEPVKVSTLTNIRGTREAVKLARESKKLKSIVHISTAYTHATKSRINTVVKEDFYQTPIDAVSLIQLAEKMDTESLDKMINPIMTDWPNTYTFTKAVTEEMLKNISDLPLCIVRPAIVISAYREPSPGWVDIKNVMGPSGLITGIEMGISHAIFADKTSPIDFVPVDYVNNAIIVAAVDTIRKRAEGDNKINIYTISGVRNPSTLGVLYDVFNVSRTLVPSKALWYCHGIITSSTLFYFMMIAFFHFIPALIVDGVTILIGQKPRLTKLYKKMHNISSVFNYFNLYTWKFEDSNTLKLYNELSEKDKAIFTFDMTTLDIRELIQGWSYGVRKWIIKEPDTEEATEYANRKQFWFKLGHYLFTPLCAYGIYKLLSLVFVIFFYMFSLIW